MANDPEGGPNNAGGLGDPGGGALPPQLQAALANFRANLFLPRPNTPAVSNSGMFPSPNSPFNSMSDQMLNAFIMSGTLPGMPVNQLGGNRADRYAFAKMAPNIGGSVAGASAYAPANFNPYAGRGNGLPGTGLLGPGTGAPGAGGPPVGGPPATSAPPASGAPPAAAIPATGLLGGGQNGGLMSPAPGQGSAVGVPFPNWGANFGTPPSANNTPGNAALAASMLPGDAAKLLAALGGNQAAANQMNNAYGPGGQFYNPQMTADLQRGESNGISTLSPMVRALYEQNGIISNGKWAKKQDNNGNWIAI